VIKLSRDPKRIPRILKEIERIWNQYPDLRFYQLMDMLGTYAGYESGSDKYYVEDTELEEFIKKYKDKKK